MDWSAVFPELLVASYDKNPDAAHDPDGVCLVWNTRFKKTTPEDIFHCQVLSHLWPYTSLARPFYITMHQQI